MFKQKALDTLYFIRWKPFGDVVDAPWAPPLFRLQAGPGGLQSLTAVLGAGGGAYLGAGQPRRRGLAQQEVLVPHPHGLRWSQGVRGREGPRGLGFPPLSLGWKHPG